MGLADVFSREDRVEVTFSDFFNIVKQAAQKENLMNGVNCNVPYGYIREMVTGQKEEPQEVEALEAAIEIETDEYTVITEAIRRLLKEWDNEESVSEITSRIVGIVDELMKARICEIILKNAERLEEKDAEEERQAAEEEPAAGAGKPHTLLTEEKEA